MPTRNPFENGIVSDAVREELIAEYLSTPDRRVILARSTLKPGRDLIASITFEPTDARLVLAKKMVSTMERLLKRCNGQEYGFPRDDFDSLYTDLRATIGPTEERLKPRPPAKTAWERVMDDDGVDP